MVNFFKLNVSILETVKLKGLIKKQKSCVIKWSITTETNTPYFEKLFC